MERELEKEALDFARKKLVEMNIDNEFLIDITLKRSGAGDQYTSELEVVFKTQDGEYFDTIEYLLFHLGDQFCNFEDFKHAFVADAMSVYEMHARHG